MVYGQLFNCPLVKLLHIRVLDFEYDKKKDISKTFDLICLSPESGSLVLV